MITAFRHSQAKFIYCTRSIRWLYLGLESKKERSMPLDDSPKKVNGNPLETEFQSGNKSSEPKVDKHKEREVDDDYKAENAVNEALVIYRNNEKDVEIMTTPSVAANCTDPQVLPSGKDKEKRASEEVESGPPDKSDPPDKNDKQTQTMAESEEIESKENGQPDKNEQQNQTMNEDKKRKIIIGASIASATVLGAALAPLAVVGALGAVGFGTGGVVAGSIAAAIQSSVYGGAVASGSAFAICQSVGAAGLGVAGTAASAVSGGGIFAGTAAFFSNRFSRKKDESTDKTDAKNTKSPGKPKCDKSTQT